MNELLTDELSRFFNQPSGSTMKEPVRENKGEEYLNVKSKRRSKKDKVGRNYVCGCGKEYLSYPALYTHIKTKHGGEQPEGTKAHASNSKPGRPKKVDLRADDSKSVMDKDNAPFSFSLIHQPSHIKGGEIQLLQGFVEKADLRLIDEYNLEGETDSTTGFPTIHLYDNDKPSFHPFHVIINNLKSGDKSDSILSNNCCDVIMAIFLFSSSKVVNEKFYLVLGVFFRNLRECLNEQGYRLIAEHFVKNFSEEARSLIPKRKEDRVFCEIESPEFLPLVADSFILEYLPKYCPEFDQQLAVDIMFDFCKWLLKRKFTKIRISFNNDYNEDDTEDFETSSQDNMEDNGEYKKLFGELK